MRQLFAKHCPCLDCLEGLRNRKPAAASTSPSDSVAALRALAAEDHVPAISAVVRARGQLPIGPPPVVCLCLPGPAAPEEAVAAKTAARLWEPAVVLAARFRAEAAAVAQGNSCGLHGLRVLELGAGLGYVGLHLACLGASVVLTDLPENEGILRRSIAANSQVVSAAGGSAYFHALDWARCSTSKDGSTRCEDCDLLVAADPVYDLATTQHFVSCLSVLLKRGAADAADAADADDADAADVVGAGAIGTSCAHKSSGRVPLIARVAHKHRPGVCCADGIHGLQNVRKPGGCAFGRRLQDAGLSVVEEDACASTGELVHHPFVSVWRITAACNG